MVRGRGREVTAEKVQKVPKPRGGAGWLRTGGHGDAIFGLFQNAVYQERVTTAGCH